MPSERKQLPKNRKRVTALARARISVRKSRKTVNNGLDGSYLHTDKETVSNLTSVTGPSTSHNSSEAITRVDCWAVKQHLCHLRSHTFKTGITTGYPRNEGCCLTPMGNHEGCMGLFYASD